VLVPGQLSPNVLVTHWLLEHDWPLEQAAQAWPLEHVYGTKTWFDAAPQVPVTCWHDPGLLDVAGAPVAVMHACVLPHSESLVQHEGAVHSTGGGGFV